jgi:hypothetical protein
MGGIGKVSGFVAVDMVSSSTAAETFLLRLSQASNTNITTVKNKTNPATRMSRLPLNAVRRAHADHFLDLVLGILREIHHLDIPGLGVPLKDLGTEIETRIAVGAGKTINNRTPFHGAFSSSRLRSRRV